MSSCQDTCQHNIHEVAKEAATRAVDEAWGRLGINPYDADEIRHFQANMQWVYRFRHLSEKVGATIILTLVTLLTGAIATVVWDAFRVKGGN